MKFGIKHKLNENCGISLRDFALRTILDSVVFKGESVILEYTVG